MAETLTMQGYLTQPKTRMLCEKWAKAITVVENTTKEKLDLSRKAALAKILENTKQFIDYQINEAVQSSDIGQYKRYALDIVMTVIPSLIAPDIVSVQPIDNRVGMVNYIKYLYNTTKGTTTEGDTFASSLNLHATDINYTSRIIAGESHVGSAANAQLFTLSWFPVIAGSLTITQGTTVITDDGDGNLVSTSASGIVAGGSVIYSTGRVSYTLAGVDADANDDLVATCNYTYNNEYIPTSNIPEIGLKIESIPVTAYARRLKAVYAFEASYELQKEYGKDMQNELNTMAAAEIAREIDHEIIYDLFVYADAGAELSWSKVQPVGVNIVDHYDSFVVKLAEGDAAIRQSTRRVGANFLVVGTETAVVASTVRTFKPSGVSNTVGSYFLGTIGNYKVYVDPELDPKAFILGHKGDTLLDAGYVYAPYMPIMTTDLVQLEDMAGRKGWATMYGKAMLNNKMYIKGKITA